MTSTHVYNRKQLFEGHDYILLDSRAKTVFSKNFPDHSLSKQVFCRFNHFKYNFIDTIDISTLLVNHRCSFLKFCCCATLYKHLKEI